MKQSKEAHLHAEASHLDLKGNDCCHTAVKANTSLFITASSVHKCRCFGLKNLCVSWEKSLDEITRRAY